MGTTVTGAGPLSAIPAALEAGGGIFATAASIYETEKNRKWQEYMSNTAHQRETRDAVAAGINPLYLAGGSGASTPTGSVFTSENPIKGLSQNYIAKKLAENERSTGIAQRGKLNADSAYAASAAQAQLAQANKTEEEKKLVEQQILTEMERRKNTSAQTEATLQDVRIRKAEERVMSGPLGEAIKYIEKFIPGTSALDNLIRRKRK